MSVYIDDANISFRNMRMCHMIADTTSELMAMAEQLGLAKWIQAAGTYREHFDICLSKKAEAIKLGAVEVSQRRIGEIIRSRRLAAKPEGVVGG